MSKSILLFVQRVNFVEPSVYSTTGRQYQKSSCANTNTVPAPPRRSASTFYLILPPQYLEDAIPDPLSAMVLVHTIHSSVNFYAINVSKILNLP